MVRMPPFPFRAGPDSSAVIRTGAFGALAASMVHRMSTLRCAVSTLTGRANTSAR